MMSSAHLVDDLYQGVVPALLPFFVAQRHYSYASVAGLTLAGTVLASVAQPGFGWLGDRRPLRWLVSAGMLTAAGFVVLAGYLDSYLLTWLAIAASGLGVAAFHPEAARLARKAAGNNNRGMSIFALGGNSGYALGTLVTTQVVLVTGLRGTGLLVIPALVMAFILVTRLDAVLDGPNGRVGHARVVRARDDWPSFARLAVVVVIRSIAFAALSSFLALFFIQRLGVSTGAGNAALTVFLVAGGAGTLLGGWLADRAGRLTSLRLGLGISVPALLGLLAVNHPAPAFVLAAVLGVAMFMPFAIFIMLGQDYLPSRIGTASGLTAGLAVTIGGLFSPLLGFLADATSLRTMLLVVVTMPLAALVISVPLRDPQQPTPAPAAGAAADMPIPDVSVPTYPPAGQASEEIDSSRSA
jgi:FSR family fosmidomycin resistance protein-like MFS transporter